MHTMFLLMLFILRLGKATRLVKEWYINNASKCQWIFEWLNEIKPKTHDPRCRGKVETIKMMVNDINNDNETEIELYRKMIEIGFKRLMKSIFIL